MTKQLAISPRDHGPCALEQAHDRVAFGRRLPLVAGQLARLEYDLGDFLLGRASSATVEGLQHAPCACPLLIRESGIGRRFAAMKGGEQPQDRLDTIEAIGSERDQCRERHVRRCAGGQNEMDVLAVA